MKLLRCFSDFAVQDNVPNATSIPRHVLWGLVLRAPTDLLRFRHAPPRLVELADELPLADADRRVVESPVGPHRIVEVVDVEQQLRT